MIVKYFAGKFVFFLDGQLITVPILIVAIVAFGLYSKLIFRQGNHHRYSHEFKQLLNLAKSKGFTVLLLRKRGRGKRNSEFKFTALQLETLRKVWGNEIVKQIRYVLKYLLLFRCAD